jgi:hypothetical protein
MELVVDTGLSGEEKVVGIMGQQDSNNFNQCFGDSVHF